MNYLYIQISVILAFLEYLSRAATFSHMLKN